VVSPVDSVDNFNRLLRYAVLQEALTTVFRQMDLNQNGEIDREEFVDVLHRTGAADSEEGVLSQVFDRIDRDGSGQISLQEFIRWAARQQITGQELYADSPRATPSPSATAAQRAERAERRGCCVRTRATAQKPWAVALKRLVEHRCFNSFVLWLILLNTAMLASDYHSDSLCDATEDAEGRLKRPCMSSELRDIMHWGNLVLTLLFALEMILKLLGIGSRAYVKDAFNRFDGLIVVVSVAELIVNAVEANGLGPTEEEGGGVLTLLRAGRLMRVFRSARAWPALTKTLRTLGRALPKVTPLSLMLLLLVVIYALLGMMLFGGRFFFPNSEGCGQIGPCAIPRSNFDDFPTAMVVVFQILTGEDWNVVFYNGSVAIGMASFAYFVVVVIFGNYIVISLFVAILLEGFSVGEFVEQEGAKAKEEKEKKVKRAKRLKNRAQSREGALQAEELDSDSKHRAATLVNSDCFERLVLACICLSSVQLAYQDPVDHGGPYEDEWQAIVLLVADKVFLGVFSFEFLLKHWAYGVRGYWREGWNILDGTIVLTAYLTLIASAVPGLKALRGFRALRALRPLRAMRRVPSMRLTVNACFSTLPLVAPIGMVTILFFIIFAILGVQLFAGTHSTCKLTDLPSASGYASWQARCLAHDSTYVQNFGRNGSTSQMSYVQYATLQTDFNTACSATWSVHGADCSRRECLLLGGSWETGSLHFDNVGNALKALLESSTTEGWPDAMWAAVDAVGPGRQPVRGHAPAAALFFVAFMIVGKYVMLNMFTSALIEQFLFLKQQGEGLATLLPAQRKWVDAQRAMLGVQIEAKQKQPTQAWRRWAFRVSESRRFEWGIIGAISLNIIMLASKHRDMDNTTYADGIDVANIVFVGIFSAEVVVKFIAYDLAYFRVGWNCFDFLCVATSILDQSLDLAGVATFFRVLRVLRVVKIARGLVALRQMFETILVRESSLSLSYSS
jgi:hypothetical protein